jgi:hypothetical protein
MRIAALRPMSLCLVLAACGTRVSTSPPAASTYNHDEARQLAQYRFVCRLRQNMPSQIRHGTHLPASIRSLSVIARISSLSWSLILRAWHDSPAVHMVYTEGLL